MNESVLNSLQHSDKPWVRYRTLVDLIQLPKDHPLVCASKQELLEHPLVKNLLEELQYWPGQVISSHKSAGQLYHKLAFIADLGLTDSDDKLRAVLNKVSEHQSLEGLYQLPVNIPIHFGGSGREEWGWALCDAPLLLYSFIKIYKGNQYNPDRGIRYLLRLARQNGWPCKVSAELGKFRGPGKKEDPCPYVNLIMLKLLSVREEYKKSEASRLGVECLLEAWEKSKEIHPYMFFMGKDFRKLKAPFIWYDILHVTDVLSHYEFAMQDRRFYDMLQTINAKTDQNGFFTAESEWKSWNGWDFGQKKVPSEWITFLVTRINYRYDSFKA